MADITSPTIKANREMLSGTWGETGSMIFRLLSIGLITIPWLMVGLEAYLLSRMGRPGFMDVISLSLIPIFLLTLAMFIAGTFGLVFRSTRRQGKSLLGTAILSLASFFISVFIIDALRTSAFENIAERGEPIIQAVKAYQIDHGQAPAKLDDVVPVYLPEIPGTGIGAYPKYTYVNRSSSNEPWIISVDAGIGLLNFDEFLYLPTEDYEHFTVAHKKIGKWIYIIE